MDSSKRNTQSFRDLIVWQKSHEFILLIYNITSLFPTHEQFGLTNQLRRAGVSITSNIAEGYGRKLKKDKEHFYIMSFGSLEEAINQIIIAHDLGYINHAKYNEAIDLSDTVGKLLNGLLKAHRGKF